MEALNFRKRQGSRAMFLRVEHMVIIAVIGMTAGTRTSFLHASTGLSASPVSALFLLTSKSMRWHYYFHFTVEETEARLLAQGCTNGKKLGVTRDDARGLGRTGGGGEIGRTREALHTC